MCWKAACGRGGDRLRFTGQLIEAATGVHIWADRFDGEMRDIFDLQDRITANIVGAIEPKLQLAEFERLKQKPAADLNAYDLFLRAQQLHYEFTEDGFAAAIQCLHQALAIDPAYAPAMALAAYCFVERRLQGWAKDPEAEAIVGQSLATRAVDLARDDANVLWMAAYGILGFGKGPQSRSRGFPFFVGTESQLGHGLDGDGLGRGPDREPGGSAGTVGPGGTISPRDPRAWFMASARANASPPGGPVRRGRVRASKALARNPCSTRALRILAMGLARLGEFDKAAEVIRGSCHRTRPDDLQGARTHGLLAGRRLEQAGEAARLAGMPEHYVVPSFRTNPTTRRTTPILCSAMVPRPLV